MNTIENALKALSLVHSKYKVSGNFLALHSVPALWPVELPRSADLDLFYNEFEPNGVKIETGITPIKLFDIASLKKGQLGYRWVNGVDGTLLDENWPTYHLVIMDDNGGGKPIIAITNIERTPIFASHDANQPYQIADSLADFILALAKLIDIIYGEFDIYDISDDNGIIDAFMKRLNEEIRPILGTENMNRFADYFYG